MKQLVKEYQDGITALREKRMELQKQAKDLRGDAYFAVQRRIEILSQEEEDMLFALRLLVRG